LFGATFALLPWKPHDLAKPGVGQSIKYIRQDACRLHEVQRLRTTSKELSNQKSASPPAAPACMKPVVEPASNHADALTAHEGVRKSLRRTRQRLRVSKLNRLTIRFRERLPSLARLHRRVPTPG
jgi:hypothetical protein